MGLTRKSAGSIRIPIVGAIGVLGVLSALAFAGYYREQQKIASSNYAVNYPMAPVGWISIPHGPQTLFVFQNLKDKTEIRGGVNQVISDFNPTPELGTESVAQYYIDRTTQNMPDWTAKKLGSIAGKNTTFCLIKRTRKGKEVVSAFAVQGNTTVVMTLASPEKVGSSVEPEMKKFESFLSNVSLDKKDMSNL